MNEPTIRTRVTLSEYVDVQIPLGGVQLSPGEYLQVHSHNPFDHDRPMIIVELRTTPEGKLEIFCDHEDVKIVPFEENWYNIPDGDK